MLLLLSITVLFVGCTKESTSSEIVVEEVQSTQANNIQTSLRQRPDLYGKVKKILGNEVTLELVEISEANGKKGASGKGEEKTREQGKSKNPEEMKKKMEERVKLTGETKNMIIPVGIPITSVKQGEITEMELEDIYEGIFLQIWFNEAEEGEEKTIKAVRVMQGR
jgi:hypothetical protein